jgi:MFS family permease
MRGPFQNAAFRRLLAGRVVTNVGDSLYFVAAMWLVYSLTDDPLYSGVAGFLTLAPAAFQFLAGPLVDRWSIRRTLAGTQVIQAVVVSVVPVAHALGALRAELVLVVMPLLAALNQLVYPAQTAALPRLLDDEDLVAANSAFSVAYQGVDMVANGLGGLLVGVVGAVALFAVDAVTFGVAAVLFVTVRVPAASSADDAVGEDQGTAVAADGGTSGESSYVARLREGAALLRGTVLVPLLVGTAAVNFASGMALAAMPAYADALGTAAALGLPDAAGAYGVLMAAFAAGNLFGAVGASAVADRPLGRTLVLGFAVAGVLWTAAVAANWLPATAALFVVALVPVGAVNVQMAAVVQSAPPERYVGRVGSLLGSASAATIPFGALAGGAVAADIDPRAAVLGLGLGALALAAYVLVVPRLRALPAPDAITLEDEAA